jgi:polypeptide N-acetylgalactosaminyltransferase
MFATTKRWWTTIGGMDTDLSTWGGENIEISLRTWLCGGEIRVARGSRIDHAFRTKFPYTVDGGLYRHKASGILPGSVPFGSIDEQLATQKRLKCKPFAWYLKKFANRSPIDKTP